MLADEDTVNIPGIARFIGPAIANHDLAGGGS